MSDLPRVALVTGGSRGIGRKVAERLASDGFEVYLTYVSRPEEADKVVAVIEAQGGKARAFKLDSGDRDAIADFFRDEIKGKATLEVLVNNAGITRDGLMMRMKDEDWDTVLRINLTGCFAFLKEASKIMGKQRLGRIINITSIVGQMGNAGQANYCAAKAGLIGLTKSAARELAGRNITVNAVAPGFIKTDMTDELPERVVEAMLAQIPLNTLGQSEDIAAAVSFLAGPGAGYITGQVLGVNGGMYM
ncbi:MAG: 3-oxoacyl-[acyl-carrier-protein] reductase [Pseudodesulfovibrio sp.]|uniref:3-oxoacyl-[acyl-carrier-protein] reductase n=1 Tax=Pseudodesulfovibrio aespoeensis (strain ATCC 700646 / DSM 10631 / Aspo-2) TaxID=643562 RepID=E6VXH6_PSEA9|nr:MULTISPECIES: 3-oxoacyl-[acyl-carrier-protein] reductase [Pseudodesulfovibrio]MBU4242774.1 3-oxoacyl-[acyl-carrier-protein] reductase [Pseudomonadota bacterium]ADU63792.1 3-oxoacyl-(acyl-carrier-protein) reductase [Pseudodesulfovibrio aespoeensis Aspo-2]MBU4378006.1 3-oxoacyl-[acyl-carrier-protein] reductase [Pseudomonadota bacterium]MBU4475621.1 3-oxoacyl-[acyl-carrier-protein] reductase [Pseudomonadota bacterium]MBU4515052.1 3-oxoacyl-[acyl-carrier-protein] reductase [Pseudomonadota bacte